jgi:4-amino-4-deoxy-L-arabinose transferase-like glycosyltransferase
MSNTNPESIPEDDLTATQSAGPRSHVRIAAIWLLFAALATVALFMRHRHVSLDGDYQGWASASCMIMGRAFAQLGLWHTHFVPFQNNLPVGADPDVYLHWPPLYPIVLSWFIRMLGDSPASGRMLELAIVLASAAFVCLIGQRLYTQRIGVLAAFFFLTARATFEGGSAILQQPLAILFALISVYCFLRAIPATDEDGPGSMLFALMGALATVLAILSAWDPIFIPFGLFAAALYMRRRRAAWLAATYCFVAVVTFAGVQLVYVLSYPKLFANQLATIAYRAGLPFHGEHGVRLATIVDVVHYDEQFGIVAAWWRAMRNVEQMFSSIMLAAALIFAALWWRNGKRDDRAATWVLGGLLLPTVVWFAVMRNYVAIHSFPLVLAAPFIAIAAGFVLDRLWTRYSAASADRPLLWVLLIGVPLLAIQPLLIQYRDSMIEPKAEFASLSKIIHDSTPEDAIVLTSAESLVPVYYSQRHVIRGINSETWLKWAIPETRKQFPGSPLFFAVRDSDRHTLPEAPQGLTNGIRLGDTVLYEIP